MSKRRFFFLEPSKVGSQHITLIEGYLKAILGSDAMTSTFGIVVGASRTTWEHLEPIVGGAVRRERVPVMDPEKRRLVLKSLLEFMVVLRYMIRMGKGDILFVTCLLPPALILVEMARRILRRGRVLVTLHGEIEGLFDARVQGLASYGFWICKWMNLRTTDSRLELVVIDDFIKSRLLGEFPDRLAAESVHVIHHPVRVLARVPASVEPRPVACFIGYKTRHKGFDQFEGLADAAIGVQFVRIGGGQVEVVGSGTTRSISGNDEYLTEIGRCSVAVFPYTGGYTCSLSAAALDAMSAGVHIVALDRPCFTGLAEYLGEQFVTIAKDGGDLSGICKDVELLKSWKAGAAARLAGIPRSRYGLEAVGKAFERAARVNEHVLRSAA